MSKPVWMPNGKPLYFPDGWTDEQIDAHLKALDQREFAPERGYTRAGADFGVKTAAEAVNLVPGLIDMMRPDEVPEAATGRGRLRTLMGDGVADTVGAALEKTPGGVMERALVRGREVVGSGLRSLGALAPHVQEDGADPFIKTALRSFGPTSAALSMIPAPLRTAGLVTQLAGGAIEGDLPKLRAEENQRRVAEGRETLEEESAKKLTSRVARGIEGRVDKASRALMSDMQGAIDTELGKASDGGVANTLKFLADSPVDAFSSIGPSAIAWLIPSVAAGKVGKIAGMSDAARTTMAVQGTSALAAESGARDIAGGFLEMPQPEMDKNPKYAALRDMDYTDLQARLALATEAYDAAFGSGAAIGTVTGKVAQSLGLTPVEKLLAGGGRKAGAGRIASAIGGAIKEIPGEGLQGGGEAVAANLGRIEAGALAPAEVFKGVGSAMVLEAFAGAGMGGLTGLASPQRVAQEVTSKPTDPNDPVGQAMRDVAEIHAAARRGAFTGPPLPQAPAEGPAPAPAMPAIPVPAPLPIAPPGSAPAAPPAAPASPAGETPEASGVGRPALPPAALVPPLAPPAAAPAPTTALTPPAVPAPAVPPASTQPPLAPLVPGQDPLDALEALAPVVRPGVGPTDAEAYRLAIQQRMAPQSRTPDASPTPIYEQPDVVDQPGFGMPPPPRPLPDDSPLLRPHWDPDNPALQDNSPERVALRERLIEQRLTGKPSVPEGQRPLAVYMGGGSASGKGTILKAAQPMFGIDTSEMVHLDPDSFKTGNADVGLEGLPEYQQIKAAGDMRAAEVVHEESSHLYRQALERARSARQNLVLDRTMSDTAKAVDEIKALKKAGYEVRIIGVTVDPREAIRRSVIRSTGKDARFVPLNPLLKAHKGFTLAFAELAKVADRIDLYDNNVGPGEMPRLVATGGAGRALEIVDQTLYNNFVSKGRINDAATTYKEIGYDPNPRDEATEKTERDDGRRAAPALPVRGLAEGTRRAAESPGPAAPPGEADPSGEVTPGAGATPGATPAARAKRASIERVVNALITKLNIGAGKIRLVYSSDDLPKGINLAGLDDRTEGIYHDGVVYLIVDALKDPARAVWVTMHEFAGHLGLRALLPEAQLTKILDDAATNPTIAGIARAMQAEARQEAEAGQAGARDLPLSGFVEEALAEMTAAQFTGDINEIFTRYGAGIEAEARDRANVAAARSLTQRMVAAIKRFVFNVGAPMTDAQVSELIGNAYKAAQAAPAPAAPRARPRGRSEEPEREAIRPEPTAPADPVPPTPDEDGVTMQNRDRSRAASVSQMQAIKKNPDPARLSFSRDPNTGAPMIAAGRAIPETDKGKADTVVMASGRRVPVQYAVIESAELAASHNADGMVNPDYANAPLRALNNARTAGLQAAHEAGNAGNYVTGIADDAGIHGVSAQAIASKKRPVLVRLYDPALNTGDMGAESNASAQLGLSPVEQAQTDARALPDMAGLQWSDDGSLPPAANASFFRAWFANLGEAASATLQDALGRPNAAALSRVRAAMVERAYDNDQLLTALSEEVNPDNRNVLNALVQAAPAFAVLEKGDPLTNDIRGTLSEAFVMLRDAASRGLSITDAVAQADLLGRSEAVDAVALFMAENARSAKRMGDAFKAMAAYVDARQRSAATLDIFGNADTPSIRGAIDTANKTLQETYGPQAQIKTERLDRERNAQPVASRRARSEREAREGAETEAAPRSLAGGLFGAPTAREVIDSARRDRDAKRDGRTGTGRTDMAAGDGDLFAGDRPDQMSMQSRPFFSALSRAVDQANGAPKRADATAWKGWLDGAQRRGEFKQAERDWLGVDAWLDSRPTTTREELAEFVRANEVRVEDVVLGKPGTEFPEGWTVERQPNDEWYVFDNDGEVVAEGDTRDEAIRMAQDDDAREPDQPKFSAYQLPGGENYRELLLKIPTRENVEDGWLVTGAFPNTVATEAEANEYVAQLRATAAMPNMGPIAEAIERFPIGIQQNYSAGQNYRNTHFSEHDNVLAHVRFNERTDADGKRVLFIEEIQSDWHQAGRKHGYTTDSGWKAATAEKRGDQWEIKTADGLLVRVLPTRYYSTAADAVAYSNSLPSEERGGATVPDAPFKATDEWAMLAFKRMARWAVDNGFDRVAWATGAQQAARYDLSKQVSSLIYKKNDDGTFRVTAFTVREPNRGNPLGNGKIPTDKLEEYVGKDVAKRIIDGIGERINLGGSSTSQPSNFWTSLKGEGLKVGGEGMRAFYDKILPLAVNKWAKKFGGRVGETQVLVKEASGTALGGGRTAHEVIDPDGQIYDAFETRQAALDAAEDAGTGYTVRSPDRGSLSTQPALDITPAMREAVAGGQPLFSRAPASQTQTPEFRRWFGESKVVDANGNPKTMYHASLRWSKDGIEFGDVEVFDRNFTKTALGRGKSVDQVGTWFSDEAGDAGANQYIGDNGVIYPVYLSIKNPWMPREGFKTMRRLAAKFAGVDPDNIRGPIDAEPLRKWLISGGYDGIIFPRGTVDATDQQVVVALYPGQIKSAIGNSGAFDPSSPSILQSRTSQQTAADLRTRKSQLARELTSQHLTAEQLRAWTQRARLLIGEVSVSPDFAQELADARRILTAERRDTLAGDREALRRYDEARDMLALVEEQQRAVRAKSTEANRLLDRAERRSGSLSLTDREQLVSQLAEALDAAESAYVAAKRIADWRAGHDGKVVKAHQKRNEVLGFLAAEGYQQGSLLWGTSDPIKGRGETARRKIRRVMQDKMIDLRDVQQEIEAQMGRALDDAQNAYRAENQMHGKVADGIERFRQRMVEPLKAAITASGMTVAEVEAYLWAQHATERNAKIRAINPGVDDGSGMTDAEAETRLAAFTQAQRLRLAAISARVEAIRRHTLETLVSAGQLERAQADTILGSYQHYVPLRADKDGEARVGGTGQGISAGSAGVQRALGRKTPPRNILAELTGDSERAIVQSGKAEVGRALLRLVLSYPNPALWSVEAVILEPKFSEATGEVYLEIATPDDAESIVVKHNGKPYRVQIKHPRLVAALRNTGTEGAAWVVRYLGKVNRWLSAVFTRFNPGFVPVNLMRDLFQGLTGVAAELGTDSAGKVMANYAPAMAATYLDARRQRGDASVPNDRKTMADWVREHAESGGKTGWTALDNMDMLQADIENSMMSLMDLAKTRPLDVLGEAFSRSTVIQAIEHANDAVENSIRVATYVHLRKDKGWSRQRAADYTKEMTVNFNRKGAAGSVINALYLFYNASMQGSRRTLMLMRHPKVAGILGGLATGQAMLAASLGMLKFEEDDEETLWEKIPDHVKRRSFVIPWGFEEDGTARWFSIPMPFGFNVFPAVGGYMANYMSDSWRGKQDSHFASAFGYLTSTAIDAVSPVAIGEEGGMWPTMVQMGLEMARNRDSLGRRISPSEDFSPYRGPRATMATPGTPAPFQWAATALNRIGGGDNYRKPVILEGLLDVSPNDLEYLFNQFAGGPGTTVTGFYRATTRQAAAGDVKPFDLPVVRSVVGGARRESIESRRFYDNKDRIERNLDRLKDAYVEGGAPRYEEVQAELGPAYADVGLKIRKKTTENGRAGEVMTDRNTGRPEFDLPDGSLVDTYRAAARDVTSIASEMRRVYNDRTMDPVARSARLITLQKERGEAVAALNRRMSAEDAARARN